jgi:hypothetical protein
MADQEGEPAMVVARLEELERQHRYLKRAVTVALTLAGVVTVVLVLGGVVLLLGHTQPGKAPPTTPARDKTLEAESFVLRDKDGKMRGAFEVVDDEPELTLYDKEGIPRATLFVNVKGTFLSLKDEKPQTRLRLEVRQDGPTLLLFPEDRKAGVEMKVDKVGPRFQLLDSNGNTLFSKP